MTSRERMLAVLDGRPTDRLPVAVPYIFLYQYDHWKELTGQQPWEVLAWLHAAPEKHIKGYRHLFDKVPFDICQPWEAPTRERRERIAYVQRPDGYFEHDKKLDTWKRLDQGFTFSSDLLNETRRVFDKKDADERVKPVKAEALLASGEADHVSAAAKAFPDRFILSGGVVGTLYECHQYVGMTNVFMMLREEPDLIQHLTDRILEKSIERIRMLATAGGDAIYIDDATTTCDMISAGDYERFCLPRIAEMVKEIHRLGKKAILIYFGGIADRVEQICATGADALIMETSMKNYTNDFAEIAGKVNRRMALFGNIDPVGVLERGSDDEVRKAIRSQVEVGRAKCKGFIVSTGSPITPGTPLKRVQDFAEWGISG
jgi:hypothetical protein